MTIPELRWQDDRHLQVNDVNFLVTIDRADYSLESSDDEFLLLKHPTMIDREMLSLADAPPQTIIDLGIFQGGSAVLLDQLFSPKKLVTIDWNTKPIPALDSYIRRKNRAKQLKPYFGVDQGDSPRLKTILDAEFGSTSVDFVIDDASHLYAQSRASFLTIFPRVSAGGYYVIEDWGWAHWQGEAWKHPPFVGLPSMTNLIVEIMALSAARPDVVESVWTTPATAMIKRGHARLPDDFDLTRFFTAQGKPIVPAL